MAVDVVEFANERDRQRYQQLTYELRCPKCQNQNLIDSDSQISVDLRREVARLVKEGKTDSDIKNHMVARYGDFILYRPPLQRNTLVLWIAPVLMLGVGALIFCLVVVRRINAVSEDDLLSPGGDIDQMSASPNNDVSAEPADVPDS